MPVARGLGRGNVAVVQAPSEWTDDRVETLKSMRATGCSAGEIMIALNRDTGSEFTRSAVLGKIARLKLPLSADAGIKHVNRDLKRAPKRRTPAAPGTIESPPIAPEPKKFFVREVAGFSAERCEYETTCKEPPIKGRFFCAIHCAIVYTPAKKPNATSYDAPRPHYRPPTRR